MYGHWDPKVISLLDALLTSLLGLILVLRVAIMGECAHVHTRGERRAQLNESLGLSQGGSRPQGDLPWQLKSVHERTEVQVCQRK